MTALSAFGLASVTAMLICYALEQRGHWFVLGFALCCWLSGIYGWLQGAWPFALVEGVFGFVALRRWWVVYRQVPPR